MNVQGKTFLVTGASSGLGRAAAQRLAADGARVILSGRNVERLNAALTALKSSGHAAVPFDLSSVDAIPDWLKRICGAHGPLDGIASVAGVHGFKPIAMLSEKSLTAMMQANLYAPVALLRGLRQKSVCRSGGAAFVAVGSVMGLVGEPSVAAYCASKGALAAFVRSAALELSRENIRVNCVAPGYVETELSNTIKESLTEQQFEAIRTAHPLGLGKPEDVSAAIAFLLSDEARWITGTTLVVDGGYTAR